MSLANATPLAIGRFKRLPQRSGEVWQGGIVRFPMWVDNEADPDGPPFRPTGVLWVSLRTGLLALGAAFAATDGALEWLARRPRRPSPTPRGRRRRR